MSDGDRKTSVAEAAGVKSPGPVPQPNTYTYRTWGGSNATVTAYWIEFAPGYVVFRDHQGRVVLAERDTNVHGLRETGADGEVKGR